MIQKLTRLLAPLSLLFAANSHAQPLNPKVYTEKQGDTKIIIYADNPNPIPYWVKIEFPTRQGLTPQSKAPQSKAPYIFTLNANSQKQHLMSLSAKKNQGYSLQLSTLISKGPQPDKVQHNDNHIYLLPFEHGKKYPLGQGYFGSSTHQGSSGYALDFSMDEGTPITAAREGIVESIKQDSNIGGPSANYAEYGNHIAIYHQDGTFASYAHIKKNGAKVKVGQRVKAGQLIALSGNTGQSSGPHLHFEVYRLNATGTSQSLPTHFYHHDGSIISNLIQGNSYYATHPGKPSYPVVLGDKLTNQDFEFKNEVIKQNDKITITADNIDDTTVVYVLNGYKAAKQIHVNIELNNLKASKTLPIAKTLLPTSKSFLVLLTPIDKSKPASYKISYQHYR